MITFKNILSYITARARERSTWLGIISLVAAFGLVFSPEQKESIVALGMAAAGLIAAFSKDNGNAG